MKPIWMEDYEVNMSENPLIHYTLFLDSDSITFETTVKETKWRKAMDDEIEAIEKNQTWELIDLPKGKRALESNGCTRQN